MPEALRPANIPSDDVAIAIRAWNMLGGLDWAGLPVVVDILGIRDVEMLITQLRTIRDRERE